ncbi:MAG: flavodoxin family protein [Clostridia bacterium]|nr:flavodoxin family protein [Clostridia bacterium]
MKVLLINGSPHDKGCTFTALNEIKKTLESESIEAEIFNIGTNPVRGCIGCGGCSKNDGKCVFTDDVVNEIIEKAKTSDAFVFGSPVHYAAPAGALCAVLDRVFYAGSANFKFKPGAAIVSCRRAGTTASLDCLNKYFTISNMPVVSSSYWNMVHGSKPEDVLKDEEGLQIMRGIGQNMAWLLKCIELGKNNGIDHPVPEAKIRTNFIK